MFMGEEGEGGLRMVFVKRNVLCLYIKGCIPLLFKNKRVHSSTIYIGATKSKTQNYIPNIFFFLIVISVVKPKLCTKQFFFFTILNSNQD